MASEDSSAASEIGSIGCGTSSEVTSDTSDSEKESSAKRRKIETPHPHGSHSLSGCGYGGRIRGGLGRGGHDRGSCGQ